MAAMMTTLAMTKTQVDSCDMAGLLAVTPYIADGRSETQAAPFVWESSRWDGIQYRGTGRD